MLSVRIGVSNIRICISFSYGTESLVVTLTVHRIRAEIIETIVRELR